LDRVGKAHNLKNILTSNRILYTARHSNRKNEVPCGYDFD